jgi:hypothetical protein
MPSSNGCAITHEHLRERFEQVVADRGKVPGFVFEQLRDDRVDCDRGGEAVGHEPRSRILRCVDAGDARNEREEFAGGQFAGVEPQLRETGGAVGRIDAAFGHGPLHAERRGHARDPFIDAQPKDRLGGMARGPVDNDRAEAALRGDVPEGLGRAAAAGCPPPVAADRIRLAVGEDAVSIGPQAGRHARPCERCDRRRDTHAISHRASCHEAGERRQPSRVEERVDEVPVSRIPADKEHA